MKLSKKAERIQQSVTLAITAKAKEMKANNIDVISFGAGEPDFNTPNNIIEAAIVAMKDGNTKYTATSGILSLREAICKKFKEDNGLVYTPSQIVVSTGAKQSLANIFLALINDGDEVIIPKPYWVSYPELVSLAGGVPVYCNSSIENEYKYNKDNIEVLINDRTKAIVLNSPNNPTGVVYSKEELIEIAEIAKKYDLLIISDEIYEKLIYDEEKHISIASISKDAYDRTIVINGLSKSYAMTGWRLGYTACSEKIAKLMTNLQSHMTSNTCSITQYAAVEALTGPQEQIKVMVSEFEKRRDYMVETLSQMKNISIIKPKGAFYVMVNIEKFIGKDFNGKKVTDSVSFASVLLEEEKVAVIPGAAFGLENYIRLSYATSMENIKEGLERIKKFIE